MIPAADNRAVTALFRACGGRQRLAPADVHRPASGQALHRTEMIVLATLVALVSGAAVAERLVAWCGPWLAAVLWLPALFVFLHPLAFMLGPIAWLAGRFGGPAEAWRWRVWAVALGAWSAWAVQRGSWPAVFGWLWLGLLAVNLAAWPVLIWQTLMRRPGRGGVVIRFALALLCHLPLAWFAWQRQAWPALASGAAVAALWCHGTLSARSRVFGPLIDRLHRRGVWLTIDDGPDPATTPRLLDLLDQHQATATFFVIGQKVRAHPELSREIIRRGHTLGNHSETHPVATFWCAGPARTRREITACSQSILETTGVNPRWFRAPVGHRNYFTHPVTLELGMHVVGWSRRGLDGVSTDVKAILSRLLDKVGTGETLVIHDATPVAADVLAGVLEGLAARNLPASPPPFDPDAEAEQPP